MRDLTELRGEVRPRASIPGSSSAIFFDEIDGPPLKGEDELEPIEGEDEEVIIEE